MITLGSAFTGACGLDLAVEAMFDAEIQFVSDISTGSVRFLKHRYPNTPNLGDITQIDWTQIPPVDIWTSGWPCQPFSRAGARRTEDDDRALWPEVERAITALRPRLVVLENVAAIAQPDALGRVELARATRSLAGLGFDVRWRLTYAREAGAPHRRARMFIVATDPNRPGLEGWGAVPSPHQFDSGENGLDFSGWVAPSSWGCPACGGFDPDCGTCNTDIRVHHAWGDHLDPLTRWAETTGWHPPAARDAAGRLTGRFAEWMQGFPPGWVTNVPGMTRAEQIQLMGNSVNPWQAMYALNKLAPDRRP